MRKVLRAIAALILAMPAISYAGSATSRWDMTLGGYVKFDVVYANRAVGVDNRAAPREGTAGYDRTTDSTSNLTWADAETRLNWAIKGPDAWGAKTSAYVEGDFRGRAGASEYGLFDLRHAYFQMIWPKTKLLVGHTYQAWGRIPGLNILAFSEEHFNKGATRVPQIRITQAFTKNFTGVFAVQAGYGPVDGGRGGSVDYEPKANGLWPDVAADISYASAACGNIGPHMLKFGLGGFYGKDQYLWDNNAFPGTKYEKAEVDRYGAGFYWFIPIIPEKKGNKAGALAFTGQLFAGKGMGTYLPAYAGSGTYGAYNRATKVFASGSSTLSGTAMDLQYYQTRGGWVEGTFYFTDKLFVNAVYGAQYNYLSAALINAQYVTPTPATTGSATPTRIQNAIFNVMYDVNQAVRLGLEYDWVATTYAFRSTPTDSNKGSFSSVRFGAYYFF